MWHQQYGEDPFGNIIKHIADLYEVRKVPKVSLYAPFVILQPKQSALQKLNLHPMQGVQAVVIFIYQRGKEENPTEQQDR